MALQKRRDGTDRLTDTVTGSFKTLLLGSVCTLYGKKNLLETWFHCKKRGNRTKSKRQGPRRRPRQGLTSGFTFSLSLSLSLLKNWLDMLDEETRRRYTVATSVLRQREREREAEREREKRGKEGEMAWEGRRTKMKKGGRGRWNQEHPTRQRERETRQD